MFAKSVWTCYSLMYHTYRSVRTFLGVLLCLLVTKPCYCMFISLNVCNRHSVRILMNCLIGGPCCKCIYSANPYLTSVGYCFVWSHTFEFSAPVQTGPGAHPASHKMGTGSLPEVKSSRGVVLTPHPILVPWSWMCRAIPLLPLWAVRPVQSLSACTREHFNFTLHIWMCWKW